MASKAVRQVSVEALVASRGGTSNTKKRYEAVSEEKVEGATYTPEILADFVADQMVRTMGQSRLAKPFSVLDPAVGDGELLSALLRRLQRDGFVPTKVSGFETNTVALSKARVRLKVLNPSIELDLRHGSFLDYVAEQSSQFQAASLFSQQSRGEFDLVIANPPYVRTQIMGSQEAQRLAVSFGLGGRVDLYYAFLLGISEVLKPEGTAGIIVSNRFMTTKAGMGVRTALKARFHLCHVWDLGDTKLFDAAVLPAVLLAKHRDNQSILLPGFTSIYETDAAGTFEVAHPVAALPRDGVAVIPDGRHFRVQTGTLDFSGDDGIWRIATEKTDNWLETVSRHTWGRFSDIGKVRVGVKTCADKVFIRTDWDALPVDQRPELLRPLTTHHMANRFRAIAAKKARHILYPHEVSQGGRRASELDGYPKTRAYLESYRATLSARTYVTDAGRKWYEIWVPQDPAAWAEAKLVFRDISERPTFWLDLDGTIVNGDCYWIVPDKADGVELLWLAAAVANSTFIEAFYDHRFNNKLYAGRRRFITQYVEQFPLPNPETPLAKKIIAGAKAAYDAVGMSNAGEYEMALDDMVWDAFGLSAEKISG